MYKNVCHKIIVYVLVGCLSFGVPATTYYKSVHAIEYLGGALAFEEALKWLLAIVGVTAAGSVASQVDWSEVREQCVEVQLHNGASQAQVSEWWAKLAKGTLDKASSCWTSFLEWSQSLVDNNSGGGSGDTVSAEFSSYFNIISSLTDYGSSYTGINNVSGYSPYACTLYLFGSTPIINFWLSSGTYTYDNKVLCSGNSTISMVEVRYQSDVWNFGTVRTVSNYTSIWGNYTFNIVGFGSVQQLFINFSQIVNNSNTYYNYGSGSGSVPVESDWKSAIEVARQNLNLLNRDLPDENASEVAIPMPGLADSDNEVSADAYDNIVDAINDGTITLDDGIAQIQDLLHVLVIDDTTDIVQPVRPDPDTGEPEKKDDVIKDNKSNMGFTLAGLEKVFPFCIPFDIYAFLTLLVAEPVAPEFDFPVKSVNNQTEEIHIDLSPFEPVAVVVRYIFDFLFIIGLALMTRSLIGGGSSD